MIERNNKWELQLTFIEELLLSARHCAKDLHGLLGAHKSP